MGTVKGVIMTEFNRKTIKAIFENAGLEVPPKDVLTELCDLHQQNGSEKDDRIKELEASLTAAEQERDALKEANGDGFKQKYEDEHKAFEDFKKSITEILSYTPRKRQPQTLSQLPSPEWVRW